MSHHTTPDPDMIRQLVSEVVARIRSQDEHAISESTCSETANVSGPSTFVTIDDRVITLATITHLPKDSTAVHIQPKAVVTPSALESARDQGIRIVRSASSPSEETNALPFIIGQAECDGSWAQRYASIIQDIPHAQQLPASGLTDVITTMAMHASRNGARGVLLCGRPHAALVLLNRNPGVRAVMSHDPRSLEFAIHECAANIIIVNPKIFPRGSLRRACTDFASAQSLGIPDELTPVTSPPCPCQHLADS